MPALKILKTLLKFDCVTLIFESSQSNFYMNQIYRLIEFCAN